MISPTKDHWNKVYELKPIDEQKDALLDVGSGATTLLRALLEQSYQCIHALALCSKHARSNL